MCGLVLLYGPNAGNRLPDCLNRLRHRGPDDQRTIIEKDFAVGFARLEVNGVSGAGRQPYQYNGLVGAINGEIYNYQVLEEKYGLAPSPCDTSVVLPLFDVIGVKAIDEMDGFYSGIVIRKQSRQVFCLRDHIGKKPLFVGRSENEVFITSELKALHNIDWFESLPLGVSTVDLDTGKVSLLAKHNLPSPYENLSQVLERAVRKRMPQPDQPVGVFLSGGLDSSIVASFVSKFRGDVTYFTLGNAQSPDHQAVMTVAESLGLRDVRIVSLPSTESISELIKAVVYATESFNPSIVSNGLSTYLLAQAAKKTGIKVILTGEGADELFGGYHYFSKDDPWQEVRKQLIEDMQYTELRRLDLASMAQGVEVRCPFLDIEVRSISDNLGFDEMYADKENKVELRRCFKEVLPRSVLKRRKTSFDVGSGIRGQVVQYLRRNGKSEREELLNLWQQFFAHDATAPYFHSYPVFDTLIDRRGEVHR